MARPHEKGAGCWGVDAIVRSIIDSLHLSRFSSLEDFQLQSKKSGNKFVSTITVQLSHDIRCAEKRKSPSTRARDVARAQQFKERKQKPPNSAAQNSQRNLISSRSEASGSIGQSSELHASSSSISAPSGPPSVSIQRPLLAKRARTLSTRVEAVNPPLLAPSSSSPASMALDRPMSLNSSPTKELMTDSTSGTRSGSIQAPAVVPTYSTIVSSSPAPATPSPLVSSSGQPSRPTAAPPDSSSAPANRSPFKSLFKSFRAALSVEEGRR